MNSTSYLKRSLADYLLPENEPAVLQSAKDISVIDFSTKQHKKVVIPIIVDANVLREATLSLLQDQIYGKYGLFKVQSEYQDVASYVPGVDFLVRHFMSEDYRTLWSAHRFVGEPSGLTIAQQVEWARSPNIAQGDLNVNLSKKIYFGDERDPLTAEEGQAFMEVYCDHVLPIKTFFTPSEMAYIVKLQKGK